jgi:hypothetical protein
MALRCPGFSSAIRQIVVATVIPLVAFGQAANTGGCGSGAAPRPSPSPSDIILMPDSFGNLWSTLGVPARMRFIAKNRFLAAPEEIDCTEECEAKIVFSDHILPDGEDSIVRVSKSFDQKCRFLLLHMGPAGWVLFDYLDSPDEKYEPPQISVESSQDQRWVVKSSFDGRGTGVYLLDSEWFEIGCDGLKPLLTLPLRGDDMNARPARHFSTRFTTYSRSGNRQSLEFAFVVRFDDYQNSRELWQEERKVVYSRANARAEFAFDPAASNISSSFADKIFSFDSMNEDDFVEFAYNRLLTIARSPADARRTWLRQFLQDASPSARVSALKTLIAGAK